MERGEERQTGDVALLRPTPGRGYRRVAFRQLTGREHLGRHRLRGLALADTLAEGAVASAGGGDVKIADPRSGIPRLEPSPACGDEAGHLHDRLLKACR